MKKLKVMTVVGTRPEIIRLSRIIPVLDNCFEHTLVHTGQNYDYELNQIFFDDLEIRMPDYFLEAAGSNSIETIGNTIVYVDKVLEEIKPEALLVLGDTNSCLSIISAKRKKIPTFHMEAGNRCFDMRVPEEINRKIVDHTADVNLPYSSISREYLIREGVQPELIIKTGSPMFEVLKFYKNKIDSSNIITKLDLKKNEYYLVSFHREENIDLGDNFNKLIKILNRMSEKFKKKIIISTHPRTRKKISDSKIKLNNLIYLIKPLSFTDYNQLQNNAIAVLSDSGTINEESSINNFPALNIRETFERPEAMEETSVMLVGLNEERVFQGLQIISAQKRGSDRNLKMVQDYSSPNVSEKIPRIIISYVDYIKRVIWKS